MKQTGVVRRLDELGRIVIPIEQRRLLDINIHDPVEINVEEGKIVIRKYHTGCIFCGSILQSLSSDVRYSAITGF